LRGEEKRQWLAIKINHKRVKGLYCPVVGSMMLADSLLGLFDRAWRVKG